MQVVDGHVHIFSPEMIRKRDQLVTDDHWFGCLYEDPRARLATDRDLLESMDEAGIKHAVACGFPWSDSGRCREHNAWLAQLCQSQPERLSFLATVVPQSKSAVSDAEAAFEAGASGVGELNADGQRFDLEQPGQVRSLMEYCRDLSKPVMLHASEPVGHGYPGKGSATPDKLVGWLAAYDEQPIVLAHWGGGLPFYELMPEVRKLTTRVYYDSAATTYLYRHRVFNVVLGLVGAGRIIFGSDFPVLGQKRLLRRASAQVGDETELKQMLGLTATSVYGLPVTAQ